MAIAPELGTQPRPDTTGVANYDSAPAAPDVRFIGITRASLADAAPGNFSVPWGAFRVDFDFPETKYGATAYEVEVSRRANFEMHLPEAERANTGISGSPSAGEFSQINVVSINPYNGDPSRPLQPNRQYYARVRAVYEGGEVSEWSEALGVCTAPLPQGDVDGPVIDSFDVTYTPGDALVAYTGAASPNPVTGSPVYDYRTFWKSSYGNQVYVATGASSSLQVLGDGMYTVFVVVTDEAGKSTWGRAEVLVDGYVAP